MAAAVSNERSWAVPTHATQSFNPSQCSDGAPGATGLTQGHSVRICGTCLCGLDQRSINHAFQPGSVLLCRPQFRQPPWSANTVISSQYPTPDSFNQPNTRAIPAFRNASAFRPAVAPWRSYAIVFQMGANTPIPSVDTSKYSLKLGGAEDREYSLFLFITLRCLWTSPMI